MAREKREKKEREDCFTSKLRVWDEKTAKELAENGREKESSSRGERRTVIRTGGRTPLYRAGS